MKVLVLGATGRTGRWVVEEAIRSGHELHCLVRDPQRLNAQGAQVKVFEGNPTHASDLDRAAQDCEAVISVLNISRTSDFPWAKLRTPKNLLSNTISQIVRRAKHYGTRRVIICSAWGVAETRGDIPKWFGWLIDHSNIRYAYQDHERQEAILKRSDLDWTIVRPVGLTHSNSSQKVIESFRNIPHPRLTISRRSVAQYLVKAIENPTLIHRSPVISGR